MSQRSLWDCIGDASFTVLQSLSKTDLVSLCLVSKAWRLEVEPCLYAEFKCHYSPQYEIYYKPPLPTFDRFLRTILRRPELGQHVIVLLLQGDHIQSPVLADTDTPPINVDWFLELAKETVDRIDQTRSIGSGLASEWKDELTNGSRDACVALLVSQLPNLREFKLGDSYSGQIKLLSKVIRLSTGDLPDIQFSLTKLCLLTVDDTYRYEPNKGKPYRREDTLDALSFFYIHGLSRLTVALSNPETFSWPAPRAPDLSLITFLHLRVIREPHLHHILRLTTRLRTFEYEWHYNLKDRHNTNPPVIQLDTLAEAIELVKSTLEELTLRASAASDGIEDEDEFEGYPSLCFQGGLQALKSFSKIQTLSLPMCFLTAAWGPSMHSLPMADSIPISARTVRIIPDMKDYEGDIPPGPPVWGEWYAANLVPEICEWSRIWNISHPHLQTVRFLSVIFSTRERETIFDAGRMTGVEVQVKHIAQHVYNTCTLFSSSDKLTPSLLKLKEEWARET